MASNKYSLIEGKTLYCILKCKPYQRKVPGIDSNLRIKSTSHCVFSDATKLNLMEVSLRSSTEVKTYQYVAILEFSLKIPS
ncbi:hypothetical protein Avbf_10017 [Armadillidium vulgare]|nr:hypothetical protein Avbf_10017 [Armadillidium vulgare]